MRVLALGALLFAAPALAACPSGAGLGDGCPGTQAGNYQDADWMTAIQLSGQHYPVGHPQTWNLPGIDFQTGNYTPTAALVDPATLPASCNYPTQGLAYCSTGPTIFAGAGTGNLDIKHFNLSKTAAHGCVFVALKSSNGYGFNIEDNRLEMDATCAQRVTGSTSVFAQQSAMTGSVNFNWNTFIGHAAVGDVASALGAANTGAFDVKGEVFSVFSLSTATAGVNLTMQYNDFDGWPSHIYGWTGAHNNSFANISFNLFDNFHTRSPDGHGEIGNTNNLTGLTMVNNVVAVRPSVCCQTALIALNQNSGPIDGFTIDRNTLIANNNNAIGLASETVTGTFTSGGGTSPGTFTVTNNPVGPFVGAALNGTDVTLLAHVGGPASGNGSVWSIECGAASSSTTACPGTVSSGMWNVSVTGGTFSGLAFYQPASALFTLGHNIALCDAAHPCSITNNWLDTTGAGYAFLASGGATCANPVTLSGNKDLRTGSSVNAWSIGGGGC